MPLKPPRVRSVRVNVILAPPDLEAEIGGTVKVSSVEGEGTTVRVNLARYVSSEDAPPASHEMHKMHA